MKHSLHQLVMNSTRLSANEAEEFLSLGQEKVFAKKSLLTAPNQIVDKAYLIKKGTIRHYIEKNRQQFTKNFIEGPRFMVPSLTNFFLETPSQLYCEALTEINVIEWQRDDIFSFADQNPRLYKFLLKSVVRAFQSKEIKEISLNQQTAPERYAQFIADFPTLINTIPVQYIASYLGVRPETLSRIRAKRIS